MTDATDAVEVAAEAATATAEVIAQANQNAEAVIEAAAERVEQAQDTAQAITDAAMATAMGQQISGLQTELGQCRETMANQGHEINSLKSSLTDLSSLLATLQTPAPVAAQPEAPSSSTPPPRQGPVQTEVVIADNPDAAGDDQRAQETNQTAAEKRRRFRL